MREVIAHWKARDKRAFCESGSGVSNVLSGLSPRFQPPSQRAFFMPGLKLPPQFDLTPRLSTDSHR